MIDSAVLFWIASAAGLIMLIWLGGKDGLILSVSLVVGLFATYFSVVQWGFEQARLPTLAIDLLVVTVSTVIALRSRRYWPTWFTGILLVSVLTSLSGILMWDFVPRTFINLSGFLLLPALWIAAYGCWCDYRGRPTTPTA